MRKKWMLVALAALLLMGCAKKDAKLAPAGAAAAPEPTPAVYAVGSSEGNDTLVLAAPTAQNTPTPVGKVEYHADAGAQYALLPDKTVSVTGGNVTIAVDGLACSSSIVASEGGSVQLTLTNGASFSGSLTGETPLDFSVSLDAASAWTLNGDVRVDALINGDTTFANIASNGHSIAYHCENEQNAYLNRAALALPGGGQLQPII